MNRDQLSKLTDEEKQVHIAEACGWRHCDYPHSLALTMWHHADSPLCPDGKYIDTEDLPDFLSDLNAMHEAEKTWHDAPDGTMWNKYMRNLNRICSKAGDEDVHATARQRADAFLLTL